MPRSPSAAVCGLTFALVTFAAPTAAQVGVLWTTYVEGVNTVETAADGSVTASGAAGITRLAPDGGVLWFAPRPGGASAIDIAVGPGGEVYAVSTVDTGGPTGRDILVYRTNADGSFAWSHTYDGPNTGGTFQEWDTPKAIVVTSTGTVVTVTETGFASNPGKAIWTQGHAADGTLLWSRTSTQTSTEFPSATRAATDCAGNVFIVGNLSVGGNNAPGILLSYTSGGTERLSARLFARAVAGQGESSSVYLNEVAADCATGAVYVAGLDASNVANTSGGRDIDQDAFVARFDGTSAAPTWQRFPFSGFSGSGNSSTSGVQNLAVGGPDAIYASAEVGEAPSSTNRVEVVRLHADGSTAWLQTRTGTNVRIKRPLVASAEGVTLLSSTTTPSTAHYEHFDPDGAFQWAVNRIDGEVGSPINGAETMVTHPQGGVVWLEGNGGHVVRAGEAAPPALARIQVVHASAALAALGPIEVYLNQPGTSTTPDAVVTFRAGSAFLSLPAGQPFTVRARLQNAPPPPIPREQTFTAPPLPDGRYVVSLAGIPSQVLSFYAANPDGLPRDLAPILAALASTPPAGTAARGGGVAVVVTHAVTDAPAVDVTVAETGQLLADDLPYGQAAPATMLPPGVHRVEVRRSSDGALLEAVQFALDGTEDVFAIAATGFLDPAANQNGPALALTATDSTGTTDGGVVVTGTADAPAGGLTLAAENPVRGGGSVRFSLAAAAHVRLVVVDALGRAVAVLADGERAGGAHVAALGGHLAPGPYLLRLTSGGATLVQRVIVVR